MALDQASSQFLQQLADQGAPPFHTMNPTEARDFFAGLRAIIGGGRVVGALDDYDTLGRFIAAAADDAWFALQWVAGNRSKVAGPTGTDLPLIIAGDSAGDADITLLAVVQPHRSATVIRHP